MYRTFCQPTLAYCLECTYVGDRTLKAFNSKQATLDKYNIIKDKYRIATPPIHSALYQFNKTTALIGVDVYNTGYNQCVRLLSDHFARCDSELVNRVCNLCTLIGDDPLNAAFYRQILKGVVSCDAIT